MREEGFVSNPWSISSVIKHTVYPEGEREGGERERKRMRERGGGRGGDRETEKREGSSS